MKTLKFYFTLAVLLPWAMIPLFIEELSMNQIIFLLYFGIFLSLPLFHLLGKERRHLFDFPKLIVIYLGCLIFSFLVGILFCFFEKIEFQKTFLSFSIVLYALQFIFLTINLKK